MFRLLEGPRTGVDVISYGLDIQFIDDLIYLDFSPANGEPGGTLADLERSDFLVAGKDCFWSVSPYRE